MNKLPQPKGWFVYCYLRTASNRPYYIGLGSRPDRMTARHSCKVPRNWSRIRVMRQELTREQAIHWERFYIARYGRKDLGTGCLMNRTAGGDVAEYSAETLEKIRRAAGSPENIARLKALAAARKGKPRAPRKKIEKDAKGREWAWKPPSHRRRKARSVLSAQQARAKNNAERHGICPAVWAAMSYRERAALGEWVKANPEGTATDYLSGVRRERYRPATRFPAAKMRELRARGWTQAAIAMEMGCARTYVSRVLSGARQAV